MASPILLLARQTYWPLSAALTAVSVRRRPWSSAEVVDDSPAAASRRLHDILTDGLNARPQKHRSRMVSVHGVLRFFNLAQILILDGREKRNTTVCICFVDTVITSDLWIDESLDNNSP